MKIILTVLLVLAIVWLLGDFIYSRVVVYRAARWEATIRRDGDGVREGCQAYTTGTGETALLLIHGINDSPAVWQKMAPRLAEHGFTCRALRLPGFALSTEQYARTSRAAWLAEVDREIHLLRQDHRRVVIVAHSLGGAVAIAYLLDHPDAADAAVLIAPAVEVSSDRSPLLSTRAWHEFGRYTLLFSRVNESPFANDAHDPDQRDYPWRTPFTPRHVVSELFALMDSSRGRAAQFRVPLLMVLSKDDQVTDWRAAERFYEDASSPNKAIYFTKDTGHAIPVDYGWDELTDAIAVFAKEPNRIQ